MQRSVKRNAAPDHIRIAAESLLPKTFRDHRHVGTLFFFRPKTPAKNGTDPKHIEIVRRHSTTKNLNGITYARKCEGEQIFAGETIKKPLSLAIMLKAWCRDRDIDQIARFVASEHVHDTRDGSLNGSPRKNKSLIKLKIVVFAPIASASVITAMIVNPGVLVRLRRAYLKSEIIEVCRGLIERE